MHFSAGTTFVSAGTAAIQSVAGAVDLSTDAALAPTSAATTPIGANTADLAANVAPDAPVTNTAVFPNSPSVSGYTAGTLKVMMHDCVSGFRRATRIDAFTRVAILKWQTVLKLAQPKCQNTHSRCPLMSPLKFHHNRDEPRGRDCSYDHKHNQFCSRNGL